MSHDLDPMRRGARGHEAGRALLLLAAMWILLALFLWFAMPRWGGGWGAPAPPAAELVGIAMAVIGLVWMVRIHRAEPEPDQHAWRYRAVAVRPAVRPIIPRVLGPAGRSRDVHPMERRRRWIGRALILVTLGLPGVVLSLWIVEPGSFIGSLGDGPSPLQLVGVAMYIVGVAWMIRIYRASPEPDQGAWRYRSR